MGDLIQMSDELGMEQLLAQTAQAEAGALIEGTVVSHSSSSLLVDIGLKQEAYLPASEFTHNIPQVGQKIPVVILKMHGPESRPLISWKMGRERKNWDRIVKALEDNQTLQGKITHRIKGGVFVDVGLDAFMPASQIDVKPVYKPEEWVGKIVQVSVLEIDRAKRNVIVSRKKVLETEKALHRTKTLANLKEGEVVKGKITGLAEFGVFVDIGGIEGLLHISDVAWVKTEDPKKIFKVGEEIELKVLKFDSQTQKISLGRKQLLPRPWDGMKGKIHIGDIVRGHIVGFAAFGMFIEIEPGVEALLHLSELSWTEKVKSPKQLFKMGQELDAKVIAIDADEEKMSLSLKRLGPSPWEDVAKQYPVGSQIEGEVTHLAPFGAFVKIPLGMEALIKTQDISWTEKFNTPDQILKKGEKIKGVVLEVDSNKEKMAIGIKQLSPDPLLSLRVGQIVHGNVSKVADFGVFVKLDSGLDALIRTTELQLNRSIFNESKNGENTALTPKDFQIGQVIEATVVKINKKERKVDLSIRKYERDQEKHLLRKYSGESPRPTLGEATGWSDQTE